MQRYLLGLRSAQSPVTAKGERAWFLFYRESDPRISPVLTAAETLSVQISDLVKR